MFGESQLQSATEGPGQWNSRNFENLQAEKEVPGYTNVSKGEPAQVVKNTRGEVTTKRTVETGAETLMTDNIGIQQGDPGKGAVGVAIGTSAPSRKPPAVPTNEKSAQ